MGRRIKMGVMMKYHAKTRMAPTASSVRMIRERQTYFLRAFCCIQLASLMFSLARLTLRQVVKSSSPMASSCSPCSLTRMPVSWSILWTFMMLLLTMLISWLRQCINLRSISNYISTYSSCLSLLGDEAVASLSLCVNRLQVERWLREGYCGGASLEWREQVGAGSGVGVEGASQQLADWSNWFLRSLWMRNCCLAVPILRAVSGSRQDCSNFWISASILLVVDWMIGCSLVNLLAMSACDSTPMALFK